MTLDNERKIVFRTQNELKNKNSEAKLVNNIINVDDFFLKHIAVVNSKIFELNSYEKKEFRNSFINNSLFENFTISDHLDYLQKNNNSIFEIFNNKEFIENFIRVHKGILEGDVPLQEANVNVFGEKIIDEIKTIPDSSQDNSDHDSKKLLNAIVYILFIIFCIYVQNLDQFKDFKEAIVFYVNSIECKGVTTSRINLRSEPSFSSEILLPIPKNSVLIIYDESHNGWVKVKVNLNNIDVEGYVSEAYIRRLK